MKTTNAWHNVPNAIAMLGPFSEDGVYRARLVFHDFSIEGFGRTAEEAEEDAVRRACEM